MAYAKNIEYGTNNKAEAWAFYYGIKREAERSITRLVIDTDSHFSFPV